VPLAASISLAGGLPFAFVRKPGYRGHEIDEPPVRGADVAGRRVLLVDDAISSGRSVERFTASLASAGAEVVGVFVVVDMRAVAGTVSPVAAALPTESVSAYLQVLDLATAQRSPRSGRVQAQRRRDREPLGRERPALGSPARRSVTRRSPHPLRVSGTSGRLADQTTTHHLKEPRGAAAAEHGAAEAFTIRPEPSLTAARAWGKICVEAVPRGRRPRSGRARHSLPSRRASRALRLTGSSRPATRGTAASLVVPRTGDRTYQ
jgi:hypothetical protein